MGKIKKYIIISICCIGVLFYNIIDAGIKPSGGGAVEGTAVLSTGETGGTKYLREDGDNTCSWQTPAGAGDLLADGTVPLTAHWNTGSYGLTVPTMTVTYDVSVGSITISGDTITDFAGTNLTVTSGILNVDDGFIINSGHDSSAYGLTLSSMTLTYGISAATGTLSGTFEAGTLTEGGVAVHNNDQMDASSELAAIIDDETGTGLIVFNDSPTLAGTVTFSSGTVITYGVSAATASFSGAVTITEGALTDSTIVGADIKDDTVDSADYAADSIDNEHINWADIDYLTDEGAAVNEAYGSGWNGDVGPPEKDDVYDWGVGFDTDSDGSLKDEAYMTLTWNFTVTSPSNTYIVGGSSIPIVTETPYAITISSISVTCDADPTTEISGDLKYADAAIGWANPVIINSITTTAGVLQDASMTSGNVAANKVIYYCLHTQPDAATKFFSVTIHGLRQ